MNANSPALSDTQPLLQVRDLQTTFRLGQNQQIKAVDGVSFDLRAGETLAVVGESGSGKSVTSLSIMGLLPKDVARVSNGSIRFDGQDLLSADEKQMRAIRGRQIGMIFQEPMTALNPVHTIGRQICEVLIEHFGLRKARAKTRAIEMLDLVGIPEPKKRIDNFPHELSGGMRQRAMIAMALACEPKALIADEPTTALDVTIQAQILDLMQDLQAKLGMAILFITHDLGVVAEIADRVVVMYCGQVVESGTTQDIFEAPRMPYTVGLMNSVPHVGGGRNRLEAIKGSIPSLSDLPQGCRFHPRCRFLQEQCRAQVPELEREDGRETRCILWRDLHLKEAQFA